MNSLLEIGVILGITEAFKRAFDIPPRFIPLFSIFFGIGSSFLVNGVNTSSAVFGIILGLSASGLYSGGKAVSGN